MIPAFRQFRDTASLCVSQLSSLLSTLTWFSICQLLNAIYLCPDVQTTPFVHTVHISLPPPRTFSPLCIVWSGYPNPINRDPLHLYFPPLVFFFPRHMNILLTDPATCSSTLASFTSRESDPSPSHTLSSHGNRLCQNISYVTIIALSGPVSQPNKKNHHPIIAIYSNYQYNTPLVVTDVHHSIFRFNRNTSEPVCPYPNVSRSKPINIFLKKSLFVRGEHFTPERDMLPVSVSQVEYLFASVSHASHESRTSFCISSFQHR